MPANTIPVQGAAAGTAGGSYRKILTYAGTAIGDYVINETNFAGVGVYLPCWILISMKSNAGATSTVQVSSDNGTTWFAVNATAAAGNAGAMVFCDTANTIRIDISGGTCDVRLFVL